MVAYQRHALFNVAVCSLALISFAALVPFIGPYRATGGFGLLGLTGLGWLFFRKRGTAVVSDERDQLITLRALQISVAVFSVVFAEGTVAVWFFHRNDRLISVEILPLMGFAGWAIFQLTHSIATIILYKRS